MNEREIRLWSKVHNIPALRKVIELLDHEREQHSNDVRQLNESLRRENVLIRQLDGKLCPRCKKDS